MTGPLSLFEQRKDWFVQRRRKLRRVMSKVIPLSLLIFTHENVTPKQIKQISLLH